MYVFILISFISFDTGTEATSLTTKRITVIHLLVKEEYDDIFKIRKGVKVGAKPCLIEFFSIYMQAVHVNYSGSLQRN